MIFIFIHGSFGSPHDAWFPWLKTELEKKGHTVVAPQFPVDSWNEVSKKPISEYRPAQNLRAWFKTFETILPKIQSRTDICIVGHSMGTLFTLHLVTKYRFILNKVFFVAPFLYPATVEELKDSSVALIDRANTTFYKAHFDFDFIRKHIVRSVVFYSDDDPYIQERESLEFAEKLGSVGVKLTGLGHMGIESNMKKFPELLEKIVE